MWRDLFKGRGMLNVFGSEAMNARRTYITNRIDQRSKLANHSPSLVDNDYSNFHDSIMPIRKKARGLKVYNRYVLS